MRKGFTLIELLVVLAVISILSALLVPVFVSAKASARRASCIQNHRQVMMAQNLYAADYEDRFVPASYRTGPVANPLNDRKWPQLLLPYSRNFSVVQCPEDSEPRPSIESLFSADLSLADPDAKFYVRAERANVGYNGYYLSPRVQSPTGMIAMPTTLSQLATPSETFTHLDSVWDVPNGRPTGGGNFLVQPPCRFAQFGNQMVPTFPADDVQGDPRRGWEPSDRPTARTYGGVWAWHGQHATVTYADGHVRPLPPNQLARGCALLPRWGGAILDFSLYHWDLR